MSGKSRNGTMHYYYSCYSTRRRTSHCDIGNIRRDEIEHIIAAHAASILKKPINLDIIANQALKTNNSVKNYRL